MRAVTASLMGAASLAARDLCWVCSGKTGVVLERLTGIGSLDRVDVDMTAVARLTMGLLMAVAENSEVSILTEDW